MGDVLQPQVDNCCIPCLCSLLWRVVQTEDTVVTVEAEGGPVPARAAHGMHSPVALGMGAPQGDAAPRGDDEIPPHVAFPLRIDPGAHRGTPLAAGGGALESAT